MQDLWLDVFLWIALGAVLAGLWPMLRADGGRSSEAHESDRRWRYLPKSYFPRLARQAGFDPERLRLPYLLLKGCLALTPLLWVFSPWPWPSSAWAWLGLLVLALVGFMLPDGWLWSRRRKRQRQVRGSLSFFLDLLVALTHSGLLLTEAFRQAGAGLRHGRPNPLADEVEKVAHELELGKDREAAFKALAERTGVSELMRVANTLCLGLRLGTALEVTLAAQAEQMRQRRQEEAFERIQRAAVQSLVPILLCGFPVFAVFIFFPAALEVQSALETLQEIIGP